MQAGCYGQALGEFVIEMNGRQRTVSSYRLHRIDDAIPGDPRLAAALGRFKADTSRIVFAPRGFKIDEPLAATDRDWSNSFLDLTASRPLGNLTADAIRRATKADVALNAAGMVRAGLLKGNTGVQTAYDVFLLAPLGIGVADQSAGGSLVVVHLTGREIKNCLEFLLAGNPNLPGQYFPRVSGTRFNYDASRPQFDTVTRIELGDLDRGYRPMDLSDEATPLYSVACNLYFGLVLASVPQKKKGALSLIPKKQDGTPVTSRVEALPDRPQGAPYLLPPRGTIDADRAVHGGAGTTMEIKAWQAIMDFMKSLPTKNDKGVSVLTLDERFDENRSIAIGAGSGIRALQ